MLFAAKPLALKLLAMELRQLRYFVTVAETLNFTEAARQLFITQGTLSQQLRQLEFELGSDLFVRSSRNVSMTEAGETMLPLARQMVETAEFCKSRMRDIRSGISGELRVGVAKSMKRLVSTTARQFMKRYPDVSLHLCCYGAQDLLRMLRAKELDMIVSFRQQEPDADLFTRVLFPSRLSAVMTSGHYLADHSSLSFKDLERFRIILPGKGLHARELFEQFFSVDMGSLKPCATSNDIDIILNMVQGTDSIALLSSADVRDRDGIKTIPLTVGNGEIPEGREMICCAQRLRDSYRKRSTLAFVDMLSECADVERICMQMGG